LIGRGLGCFGLVHRRLDRQVFGMYRIRWQLVQKTSSSRECSLL
jgi:hypothetical protein